MELRTLRQAASDLSRSPGGGSMTKSESGSSISSSGTFLTTPTAIAVTMAPQLAMKEHHISPSSSSTGLAAVDGTSGGSSDRSALASSGGYLLPSSARSDISSDDHNTSGTESAGSSSSPRPSDDLKGAGRSLSGGIIVSSPSMSHLRSTSPPPQREKDKEKEKDKERKDREKDKEKEKDKDKERERSKTESMSSSVGRSSDRKKRLKAKQQAREQQDFVAALVNPKSIAATPATAIPESRGRDRDKRRERAKSRSRSRSRESDSDASDASDGSKMSADSDGSTGAGGAGAPSRSPSPSHSRGGSSTKSASHPAPVGAYALGDKVKGVLARMKDDQTSSSAEAPRTDVDAVDRVFRASTSPITSAEQSPVVSPSVSPRAQSLLLGGIRRRGPGDPFSSDIEFGASGSGGLPTPMSPEDKVFHARLADVMARLGDCSQILKKAKGELATRRQRLEFDFQLQDIKSDEQRQRLRIQDACVEDIIVQQGNKVTLNVGGIIFETSVSILTKERHSMLAAMFSGRYSMNKEEVREKAVASEVYSLTISDRTAPIS